MLRTVNGQYNGNPRVAMILRIKGLNYTEEFKVTTSHGEHGTIAGSRWVKWGKDAEFAVTVEFREAPPTEVPSDDIFPAFRCMKLFLLGA